MHISKSYIALATTTAFAALLAGCSGGSTSQSVVRLLTPTIDLRSDLGNRIPHPTENRFIGIDVNGPVYLYGSDNVTGNVDIFPEDNPSAPFSTCAGCGGWGLAISHGAGPLLAAGTLAGTVGIYTLGDPANPILAQTLVLTGGGHAFGICFDDHGGIYADNYPTNIIDHWTSALTGGVHTAIPAHYDVYYVFYLACDKESPTATKLYAYGINPTTGAVNVDLVATPGGLETPETLVGNASSGTGYPGGLAIAANDDMVVNNDRLHKLYDMGTTEPWWGTATFGCTWGPPPHKIASIVWDNTDAEVWAGSIVAGATFAESISAPIPTGGPCARGESGGPTDRIAGEKYYGVAVYPNKGD
jgi:hypothetical protein